MAKNLFTAPLSNSLRSREYGYPQEHFDLPSPDELVDEVAYPDFVPNNGPSEYRANTGEVFQEGNPDYAGTYALDFMNEPGILPSFTENTPAPGSQSLVAPRNADEIAGTNTIIKSDGPVRSETTDTWSGDRAALYRSNPNYGGPVQGGPDYATGMQAAYFQSQALAAFSEAASNSAMVSAV